jgi:hypothetical protein
MLDILKFNSGVPTRLENGEVVNGIVSKTWVERYRDPGEFTFTAKESSDLLSKLPVGTLISHMQTSEVMVVETHEIDDSNEGEATVKVSGRSLEVVLEERQVGTQQVFPGDPSVPYSLAADKTWNQAVSLINNHITSGYVLDPNDAIFNVRAEPMVFNVLVGDSIVRDVPRGNVHSRLIDILAIDDLGISAIRPGPFSPTDDDRTNKVTVIRVYDGIDRTGSVSFSRQRGEIVNLQYLKSIKSFKNAALVVGRWVEAYYKLPFEPTNFDRRVMYIDGSVIDGAYEDEPDPVTKLNLYGQMQDYAAMILQSQKTTEITNAEFGGVLSPYRYRYDFNVGDFVTLLGKYGTSSVVRVSEYVEIEDENGFKSYPTFSS